MEVGEFDGSRLGWQLDREMIALLSGCRGLPPLAVVLCGYPFPFLLLGIPLGRQKKEQQREDRGFEIALAFQ